MKITAYLRKFCSFTIKFLHLQLFITLISLPILLMWGLPFSYLTFAGNFLFGPFLSIFLFLSSLIFFSELLFIPNGLWIYALEKVHGCWYWILQWASQKTLLAFPQPSLMLLILIPCIALAILHYKKIVKPLHSIACYATLLLVVHLYLKIGCAPTPFLEKLPCNGKEVILVYAHNTVTLIDNGVIGRRISARNWFEHTFIPHLIQKCGMLHIDHLVVTYPNKVIFESLQFLLDKIPVKNISLAIWEGRIPPSYFRQYRQLREKCTQKGCTVHRLNSFKPTEISLAQATGITITPTGDSIKKPTFSYPQFNIECTGIN